MLQYRCDDDQGGPQPPKPWKKDDEKPKPLHPGEESEKDQEQPKP